MKNEIARVNPWHFHSMFSGLTIFAHVSCASVEHVGCGSRIFMSLLKAESRVSITLFGSVPLLQICPLSCLKSRFPTATDSASVGRNVEIELVHEVIGFHHIITNYIINHQRRPMFLTRFYAWITRSRVEGSDCSYNLYYTIKLIQAQLYTLHVFFW